ncbi:hypothetical protein KFE25_003193 [Diacronema lutheri]|uniref:Uncharacterized protein n=1 Tax=Diacronema lutheri TaxID=2081491 RepID=A0A8J6C633_DIALT|nr:hypothetical protein KFE25_003193 [Diacronema lutheri]
MGAVGSGSAPAAGSGVTLNMPESPPAGAWLRVVWCDVQQQRPDEEPTTLALPSAATVAELQARLHATHPRRAPAPDRIRLFAAAPPTSAPAGAPGASRPRDGRTAVGAVLGHGAADVGAAGEQAPLVFLSRPAQTLAEAGLARRAGDEAAATVYWASELMRFQDGADAIATACDPIRARAVALAAARDKAQRGAERQAARDAFWQLPTLPLPFAGRLPVGAAVRYYDGQGRHFGGDGQIGDSVLLMLLPARYEFRLHTHRWMDGGERTSHSHELLKGEFRLARGTPSGHALHLMPLARWASYKPPIAWEDDVAFARIPRNAADALEQRGTALSADAVVLNGRTLARQAA